MKNKNRGQQLLQQTILSICHHGSGDSWQKYERCKDLLKDAERERVIDGSEWDSWIELIKATLGV